MNYQAYWQGIKKDICPRCLDGDGQGNCRLPEGTECTIQAFLPLIVTTIASVKSDSIETYINVLRRNVCAVCDDGCPDVSCKRRVDLECALDRYYPRVNEVIEHVRASLTEEIPAPPP